MDTIPSKRRKTVYRVKGSRKKANFDARQPIGRLRRELGFLFCFSYRRKQNTAEHEHCANQSLKVQNLMQENESKSGRTYRLQREFRQVRLLSLHKITFDLCKQLIQHLAAGTAFVSDIRDFAERL